ncbi:MAG: streptogrisin [Mycobacterium sp.]|jgi:hypothetical protein|nr:streptogrisin [Mycobacterium sp.]
MKRRTTLKTAAVLVSALVGIPLAPHARAEGLLAVGMDIDIGTHACSLGFFAFNQAHNRLAVTEGHCADDINQRVRANNGVEIGTVVSHMPESDSQQPVRSRGYTLIRLYDNFDIEIFFAGVADAKVGDDVTKSGARTGQTNGRITGVYYDRPDAQQTIVGSVVIIPGDSGGPWYTAGPTLIGISASTSYQNGGGTDNGSQAQPVGALVNLIRQNAATWGDDFKVWLK